MDGHRRAEFLEGKGMRIIELDVRLPGGQVDVVALDGDCLVIVEVKARSSHAFGFPAEAVDFRKRARLRRLAGEYTAVNPRVGRRLRVDVVAVDLDRGGLPVRFEHLPAIDMS